MLYWCPIWVCIEIDSCCITVTTDQSTRLKSIDQYVVHAHHPHHHQHHHNNSLLFHLVVLSCSINFFSDKRLIIIIINDHHHRRQVVQSSNKPRKRPPLARALDTGRFVDRHADLLHTQNGRWIRNPVEVKLARVKKGDTRNYLEGREILKVTHNTNVWNISRPHFMKIRQKIYKYIGKTMILTEKSKEKMYS